MTAKQFHFTANLFSSYKKGVENYFSDKLQWESLIEEGEARSKEDFWDYAIPYLSFACFIFGCFAGACSLFS